jgi:hypothetical protein
MRRTRCGCSCKSPVYLEKGHEETHPCSFIYSRLKFLYGYRLVILYYVRFTVKLNVTPLFHFLD